MVPWSILRVTEIIPSSTTSLNPSIEPCTRLAQGGQEGLLALRAPTQRDIDTHPNLDTFDIFHTSLLQRQRHKGRTTQENTRKNFLVPLF